MKNITKSLYPEVREQLARYLRKSRKTWTRTANKSHVLFTMTDMVEKYNKVQCDGLELFFYTLHIEIWCELCVELWVKLGGYEWELDGVGIAFQE